MIGPTRVRYYAGIGSRETPREVEPLIKLVTRMLDARHFVMRSGGAQGADSMFEQHAKRREIFLPYRGFNGREPQDEQHAIPSAAAGAIARELHPAWDRCSTDARLLHGRNVHQVLGANLDEPVEFVVCWTPSAKVQGGTATAIKLANERSIPVVNLQRFDLLLAADLELTILSLMTRMWPPGSSLCPTGLVKMQPCGRRARIVGRPARGTCTWCGGKVEPPRRTWCSEACVDLMRALDPALLRSRCLRRDYDTCTQCGAEETSTGRWSERSSLDVDHEIPIVEGGHPFDLANLRVLCTGCHATATRELAARQVEVRRIAKQWASEPRS